MNNEILMATKSDQITRYLDKKMLIIFNKTKNFNKILIKDTL